MHVAFRGDILSPQGAFGGPAHWSGLMIIKEAKSYEDIDFGTSYYLSAPDRQINFAVPENFPSVTFKT